MRPQWYRFDTDPQWGLGCCSILWVVLPTSFLALYSYWDFIRSEQPYEIRQALKENNSYLKCMLLVCALSPGLPLTLPCWTCPSFNSLGRCPLTSESSWTTHSEDTSSLSCGPSYTDLQLLNAEEQMSGKASRADSTGKRSTKPQGFANHSWWPVALLQISVASFVCRTRSGLNHPVKC